MGVPRAAPESEPQGPLSPGFSVPGRRPPFARWWVGLILLLIASLSVLPVFGQTAADGRSWKTLAELSEAELARLDLSASTPRHSQYPYLPAEPYPFRPPYSAEEMGIRAMEFTQRPRWSCVFANIFGSISHTGFLSIAGQGVGYMAYPAPRGLAAEIGRQPVSCCTATSPSICIRPRPTAR